MQVFFSAALDGVTCDAATCKCAGWISAAVAAKKPAKRKKGKARKTDSDGVKFPPPLQARAIIEAVAARQGDTDAAETDAAETDTEAVPRPAGWRDFPVSAWLTPDGVELAFSTLCPSVRAALAQADEPAAIATSDGGWRRSIGMFEHPNSLAEIALRPRNKLPWRDYADLRDASLDIISDRRQPLLARLAEIASVASQVLDELAIPGELPGLTARSFLAWRGFLESRVASANATKLHDFAVSIAPLFKEDAGLDQEVLAALSESLAGDWRAHLIDKVAPRERVIGDALETYFGARLFGIPVVRDVSLARAWAELFEGLAAGLRYLAGLCDALDTDATAELAVAAMAMGEHYVCHTSKKLTTFSLPPAGHGRAPRMADVDMTLASIC